MSSHVRIFVYYRDPANPTVQLVKRCGFNNLLDTKPHPLRSNKGVEYESNPHHSVVVPLDGVGSTTRFFIMCRNQCYSRGHPRADGPKQIIYELINSR